MARLLLSKGANPNTGNTNIQNCLTHILETGSYLSPSSAPGVPLPSLANDILRDALVSPHSELEELQYTNPQPCSNFW